MRLLGEAVDGFREALTVRTKEQLPQYWADTLTNLGNTLQEQGKRTGGEVGTQLLEEAVRAFRAALTVRTKEHLPQDWAGTQNSLGIVLQELGVRTAGEAGSRLLNEAVAAYRAALTVHTKEHLPKDWAGTQNNLGSALLLEGIRTDALLLNEAAAAYRAALTVYTKDDLPQDWAMTQNGLGVVLREQGIRTGGESGTRLLNEAVAAYGYALMVHTKEHLPHDWARTQNNLARTLLKLEDWRGAAEAYRDVLPIYRDNEEGYFSAVALYQEKLFAYTEAYALTQQWLEWHPDDLSAQANFAEAHFTTGRFAEAQTRIATLLANPRLNSTGSLGLRTLQIATLLAMNKPRLAVTTFAELRAIVKNLPSNFELGGSFEGSKHFIGNEPSLARFRPWLLDLFSAVEEKDARKRLMALDKLQTSLSRGLSP
jgi:tetratricopeptide (TPR) repeat protein